MSEHKYTNALIRETSPYLRQHAHNPVQWFPWSQEALRKAKEEDKPILLSIGYAACHWCHVMERESFEHEGIAALMNEFFISIKVDREERPDLDAIYMQTVQMMTGRGGWPMTVFLTPEQQPFYCGTYFPPEDRYGVPGFPRVLRSVATAYRERKTEIVRDAARIVGELQKSSRIPGMPRELASEILEEAASRLLSDYDPQNGGFGGAPKFPPGMALDFLMRCYARTGDRRPLEVVDQTLTKMARGGIYDQLGGGFHRYSVDALWLVPHFEKMLYDNALLSRAYLNAFLLTGNPLYRRIVEETLDYVLREMTSPEGGFYSTQDADSEGKEGQFYTWEQHEVENLLGGEEAELVYHYYGIVGEGSLEGRHVLHIPRQASLQARLHGISEEELWRRIEQGKSALFAAREKRVKPARDEKILTAWNGLMLKSFAEASQVLQRADYRTAAIGCAQFLLPSMEHDGNLLHSYIGGQAKIDAFLDDYACLADALLSLYESTFDPRWFQEAARLAGIMIDRFQDPDGVGFYLTNGNEELIHRPKELHDNATPSGNSTAAHALLRLARFTGDERWLRLPLRLLKTLAPLMAHHPSAFGNLLGALDLALSDGLEICIVGDPGEEATGSLLREVFRRYLPNKVVACGKNNELHLLKDHVQVSGRPTAYVCRNQTCQAPASNAADLARQLDGLNSQ
jgi:uncharacterized protein YyaL (SSP411 family)